MGGHQLSHAILLRYSLALDSSAISAMALGYRHLYYATGGSKLVSDLIADDKINLTGYVAEILFVWCSGINDGASCHGI